MSARLQPSQGTVIAGKPILGLRQSRTQTLLAITFRQYMQSPPAVVGAILVMVIVAGAVLAPVLAPCDPIKLDMTVVMQGPNAKHLMGTDILGRDIFSRILFGARISLQLGLVSVGIATLFGGTLGLVSGYRGGRLDQVVMRLIDALMAFPSFLLALTMVFALGPSLFNAMIAVGITSIPGYTRTVRAAVLSAKQNDYVLAAEVVGCSERRVMFSHILPNVLAPLIVIATLGIPWAILTSASLSFLGMGAQPPTPEWGAMANDGRNYLQEGWWISTFPGLAIAVTGIAINLMGDGLRDAFDPRLRRR
jgi:peptide/nickel transport system permease protein